ncbi:MAG TPA: TRIC cation channel family protein [Phycisphaerae bacterium]|nr:TRIC cation channel family protein [Phycisphaerae bacterium]
MSTAPSVLFLPASFDFAATFIFATSGALLAAKRGYDITGIFIVALASSTGGGLLRDGLFIQDGPPRLLQYPAYLLLIAAASLIIVAFGVIVRRIHHFDKLVTLVDAMGLGAYAVVGMTIAQANHLGAVSMVFVGMVNASGGSIARSMILAEESHLLRPGTLETTAALMGCFLFLFLIHYQSNDPSVAAWITIAFVFLIRALSVYFNIRTKPVSAFEDSWNKDHPKGL